MRDNPKTLRTAARLNRRQWLWLGAGGGCGLLAGAARTLAAPADTSSKQPQSKLRRLAPDSEAWLDLQHQRVVLRGEIVFREGPLELLACWKGTKEHEAIIACPAKAYVVHAGLMALGAVPGAPVAFRPKYIAATGPEVEVTVYWKDEKGNQQRARGQDWVRSAKTGKPLAEPWVFGGSGFWKDETTGEEHYMAESGDFICVSNFPSAMLDLPVESSQSNESLAYDCFTDRIPPIGTEVTLTLTPKLKPASGKVSAGK